MKTQSPLAEVIIITIRTVIRRTLSTLGAESEAPNDTEVIDCDSVA